MSTKIETANTEKQLPLPSDAVTEKFDSGEMRKLLDDEIARHALAYLMDDLDTTTLSPHYETHRLSGQEYQERLKEGVSGAVSVGGRKMFDHVRSRSQNTQNDT